MMDCMRMVRMAADMQFLSSGTSCQNQCRPEPPQAPARAETVSVCKRTKYCQTYLALRALRLCCVATSSPKPCLPHHTVLSLAEKPGPAVLLGQLHHARMRQHILLPRDTCAESSTIQTCLQRKLGAHKRDSGLMTQPLQPVAFKCRLLILSARSLDS